MFKMKKGKGPKDQFWSQDRAIDARENRNCGQCGFQFQSIQEIMFHVRNTEGHTPYCAHCDSKFSNYHNYRNHVRKFHFENRVITCEVCGKISKTKERHLLHWNYAHKIEDSSYCDYCGLKGLNKSKTRQHMKHCKKFHPTLAVAEALAKNAITVEMEEWCGNLSFGHFVEWKEMVYYEILENLLQGKADNINPIEVGKRAKMQIESEKKKWSLVRQDKDLGETKNDLVENEIMDNGPKKEAIETKSNWVDW